MDSPVFDSIEVEKQRAVARFNRFHFLPKFRQIVEIFMVLGLISWSSQRIMAALKSAAAAFFIFDYVFDHFVVFLLGNAIVITLVFLHRRDGAGEVARVENCYYDEYAKYRAQGESGKTEEREEEDDKKIVVYESTESAKDKPELEEFDAVIRLAVKKLEKFRRTESCKLFKPAAELQRSKTVEGVRKGIDAAEIEMLTSEEFQQVIEDFLKEHRQGRIVSAEEKTDDDQYQLLVVE